MTPLTPIADLTEQLHIRRPTITHLAGIGINTLEQLARAVPGDLVPLIYNFNDASNSLIYRARRLLEAGP